VVVDDGHGGINGCGYGVCLEPLIKIDMRKYVVYDGDGETRPWTIFNKSREGLESAIKHGAKVNSAVFCEDEYLDGSTRKSEIVWTPPIQPNSNDDVPVL
tara:strand:+ start:2492 stop:2791 length:300 start_codon:yes stop_codon:yes gene_type:complete